MNKNKLNILFVINSLELGGAETFLLRLIQELREHHEVQPFLYELRSEKNKNEFRNYFLEQSKVELLPIYYPKKGLINILGWKINALFLKLFKRPVYQNYLNDNKNNHFINFIKKNNIHLINSHLVGSDLFVSTFLKPLTKLPWVATSQGCYNDIKVEKVARSIAEKIDGLTYVADKNLNLFRQFSIPIIENNKLVYNSIKAPSSNFTRSKALLGLKDSDLLVIHVSRSIPEKGMLESILAVIKAIEEGCNQLHLAIAGPENNFYNELKVKFENNPNIHFLGEQMNPIEWVQIADIGILPTYFPGESCPSTIVEYLACKIPVISTPIGEIPNMIQFNGKSGGILTPLSINGKPSVSEISDVLKILYNNAELRTEYGEVAFNAFQKFDIALAAKEYMNVYSKAIEIH